MSDVKISIVTAVRNGAGTIADCLRSVREQRTGAEHIVMDALSSDGTVDLIRRTAPGVRCISQGDRGIYDALNKGLALATGEIVGFLHADDFFADGDVLTWVREAIARSGAESCYGDLAYVLARQPDRIVRFWRGGPFDARAFYAGWMPPHPAFFVRREIYERYGGFRLDVGTSADYELMLRFLLRHGVSSVHIPKLLVKMRIGGISNRSLSNRLRAHRMDRKAWEVNGLIPRPWTLPMKPLRKIGQYLVRP
jgi:glycosyltransferase